jgi:hypothetical protein
MYKVNAVAVRINNIVEVTVTGMLPDSCHTARIKDFYPGGNIFYIRDPEEAQVFIEESRKPGGGMCAMVLVPWAETILIPDGYHDKVGIYVNGKKATEATIKDEKGKFIVIAGLGAEGPNLQGCSIVPEDAVYLAIYRKVFGPASIKECQKFVQENCRAIAE